MSDLYELPNGWEWKKISDTFKIKSGYFLPKKTMVESGNYNVYGGNGINGKHNEYNLTGENIVIGRVGALCGNVRLTNENLWITDNAFYISDYKFNIDKVYLSNFLSYIKLGETANQSAQPVISYKGISDLDIPLPPLSEQQRIVSKLDLLFEKIDKSIALHQKNMDEANVFMGSVLNDVFGELEEKYGLIKINDVVVKTNNVNPMNDLDKPFTYIDISSIDNKSFKIVEPKQLIGSEAPSRAKKEVLLGDIVYATTRPNLKNISIVSEEYNNSIASTGFCVLRVNDNTINSYLFYYVITDKLFEQIEPNIRGAQYPATSDKDLKNCNIPNTPLNIQQKVVKYLDEISEKIEKVKSVQKVKMDSLKALKASILDRAFRGAL